MEENPKTKENAANTRLRTPKIWDAMDRGVMIVSRWKKGVDGLGASRTIEAKQERV